MGASSPRSAPTGLCELGQATSRGPRVSICRLTTLIFSAKSSCSHFFQPLDVHTDAVPPDPHRSICYLYRPHRCIQLSAMHPSSHSPIHSFILPQSTAPPSSNSSTCLYTHHLAEPRVQSQIYKECGKHTVCQLWVRARAQSPNPDPDLSTMPGTSRALPPSPACLGKSSSPQLEIPWRKPEVKAPAKPHSPHQPCFRTT